MYCVQLHPCIARKVKTETVNNRVHKSDDDLLLGYLYSFVSKILVIKRLEISNKFYANECEVFFLFLKRMYWSKKLILIILKYFTNVMGYFYT